MSLAGRNTPQSLTTLLLILGLIGGEFLLWRGGHHASHVGALGAGGAAGGDTCADALYFTCCGGSTDAALFYPETWHRQKLGQLLVLSC